MEFEGTPIPQESGPHRVSPLFSVLAASVDGLPKVVPSEFPLCGVRVLRALSLGVGLRATENAVPGTNLRCPTRQMGSTVICS